MSTEQQNNTALSSEDLLKHMQSLEKRIKSLEVTNRVILGLFIGTLAAAMTVGAGFAIAAAPIIAGSIVGGILATVALAALGVTAYKYRAEIKAGFEYAAEKTVEGAKYTAGKIRDGAVHAKDSVKEAASSLKQEAREGTSSALKKMGDGVQKLGRKMSNSGASMSNLEDILYSIEQQEPQGVVLLAKRELDPDLIGSNRDLKRDSLQSNSLSRSNSMNSLNSVGTDGSTARLLTGKHKEMQPSGRFSRFTALFSRNKEKAGEATKVKYRALPESNMPPSAKVGNSTLYFSTPTPNENTGKTATVAERPGVARRNSTGNLTKVTTPEVPTRSNSWSNLNEQSSFSEDVFNHPTVKQNLGSLSNGTLTRSNSVNSLASTDDTVPKSNSSSGRSFDSGFNSPNSSPTHVIFTEKDGNVKTQADLRKTGSLGELVGQQLPSTTVTESEAARTAVKTVG